MKIAKRVCDELTLVFFVFTALLAGEYEGGSSKMTRFAVYLVRILATVIASIFGALMAIRSVQP